MDATSPENSGEEGSGGATSAENSGEEGSGGAMPEEQGSGETPVMTQRSQLQGSVGATPTGQEIPQESVPNRTETRGFVT